MARDVRVAILGDSRDFSRAVREARGDADRLDGAFGRVASGAGRMAAGVAVAAGGIAIAGGAAALSFVRAAEESQQVTRQTEAVLRSMGATSWQTADAVAALSERLSMRTGIDDELIQSGQNVLLTFAQVQNRVGESNDIFDRATRAALDMSVALGTDMNQASMQVGRALNDPLRGLTALRRSGIQFTAQQEEQIRVMTEAGDVAGAQRVMLAELERQFGGSAEAQSTASQRLSVAWGNLQEKLGEQLLPIFEKVANWLVDHLPGALARAQEWFGRFQDGVSRVVAIVREHWPEIQQTISDVLANVREVVGKVIGYIQGAWDTFGDDILRVARGVWTAIEGVIRGAFDVIQGIFRVVMAIVHGDWSAAWDGIQQMLRGVWEAIVGIVRGAFDIVAGIIGGALDGIGAYFSRTWNGIVEFFQGLPARLGAAARSIWDSIVASFRSGVEAVLRLIDRALGPLDELLGGIARVAGLGGGLQLPSNFGGRRAAGGPVGAGQTYLVGERGPELLHMGGSSGMIVPNHALGGGSATAGPAVIVLQVNGQEFGRVMVDGLVAFNRSNGPIPVQVA